MMIWDGPLPNPLRPAEAVPTQPQAGLQMSRQRDVWRAPEHVVSDFDVFVQNTAQTCCWQRAAIKNMQRYVPTSGT